MPVAIQMPGKINSPVDALSNALNVVNQVYGIKANSAMLDKHAMEMKAKEEETARLKGNILTPKELLEQGSKYNVSDAPSAGALAFKVQDGDTIRDVYLKPRPTNESPLLPGQMYSQSLDIQKKQNDLRTTPENQEVVTGLSKSNASKMAIANQIDAVTTMLDDPKISKEQKVIQGKQLIKVLNSTEGKDAVGAEEAKRLGGLLEFQMFNFTNPGPAFGRADISDFSEQAKLTGNGIKSAINANQAQIDQLLGGQRPSMKMADTRKPSDKKNSPLIPEAKADTKTAAHPPGTVLRIKGKNYQVGPDGEELTEMR